MPTLVRYPSNASVYEALRARHGAIAQLQRAGLTRDYLEYRLDDAARVVGMPLERFTEILVPAPQPVG